MATIAPPARDSSPSLGQRWYVLIVMMLVYTINIADRYVMSTVLEPIRVELGLSDGQVAFLTGVSLALFYVTMGLPLSWVADRYNRRNLLSFSIAVWSLMTALCGMAVGYWQLLLARIGVGIGEAGGTPPCNTIVADYFPPDRRTMAMTIFALGAPIGAWLGADMAGQVANAYGWHAAFYVLGVPGILLALLILFTIKEPPRGRYDAPMDGAAPDFITTMQFLWSQKAAVHTMMGSGLSALWGWGLMWFTPAYIERSYGLPVGGGGGVLAPIHLIGGIGASLLTAWLFAKPSYTDPRKILRVLAVVTALATVPSFLAYYTHSLETARLMWWLFIPAIYFYIGPAFALGQNFAPPKMRAMFIAVSLLVANVFNLIVAPQAVGWMSDYFAGGGEPSAASLRMALLVLAPTGFWAAWHYWRAERLAVEDQKRAVGYV
ncbi:MFS transporter [Novosphingobium sp.]|uniref:spinster family MFS transporter n=1 Tax=Novosphingobium sp. TaxID=1874826 RepID=UPI00286C6280|nr:MFS transporter [Novosphingobium sp.]